MANLTETISKTNQSKSFITYGVILLVFIVALVLSTQSEGPSKFPSTCVTILMIRHQFILYIIVI